MKKEMEKKEKENVTDVMWLHSRILKGTKNALSKNVPEFGPRMESV